MSHHLILYIKFYWNTAHPFILSTPVSIQPTELSSCYRDFMAHELENIYYLAFTESFPGVDYSYRNLFSSLTRTFIVKNEFNVIKTNKQFFT